MGRLLVSFWLLTSPLAAQSGRGGDPAPPSQASLGRNWPLRVEGFGLTHDDARNDAIRHLGEQMADFLRHQDPPLLAWQPSADYVKRHVIAGGGKPGEDFLVDNVGATKTWIYFVRPLDLSALTFLDQEAQRAGRRQERLLWTTQAFGGYALLLTVLAGYLRLNEWTRRRYRLN